MSEMSGVETFKLLKEKNQFDTPVIALTADADIDSKEKYLALGFDGYIPKPINIELLKKGLSNWLNQ